MNVWELDSNFKSLDSLLEESAGELTPEIEEALATLITESKGALEKAGFYRQYLEAQITHAKDRRATLAAGIEQTERKLDRLEAAMVTVLEKTGKQKFPEFTLSTTTRTSYAFELAPGTDIFDLPTNICRFTEPVLDKRACAEVHKAGHLPAGIAVAESTKTGLMLRKPTKKTEPDTPSQEIAC